MSFDLPYRFRRTLGMLLRHVKTCRTRRCRKEGEAGFTRARPWYGAWLIPPANWYLGWLSTGVSILPTRQWLDWECRLHAELSGLIAQRAGRRKLLLPQIEGEELAAILSSPAKDLQHKDRSLRLAAAALMHARTNTACSILMASPAPSVTAMRQLATSSAMSAAAAQHGSTSRPSTIPAVLSRGARQMTSGR